MRTAHLVSTDLPGVTLCRRPLGLTVPATDSARPCPVCFSVAALLLRPAPGLPPARYGGRAP